MFKVLSIFDVANLKWRPIDARSGLQQHVIDEAIIQWCGRCARVWTVGRHFKHFSW